MSRLAHSATWSASVAMAFRASLPTTTSSPVEEHHAGREPLAFGVDQRGGLALLVQPGDHRERGAQVDAHGGNFGDRHRVVDSVNGQWWSGNTRR